MGAVFWISFGFPLFGVERHYEALVNNVTYLTVFGGISGALSMFVYDPPIDLSDAFARVIVCVMTANMLTQLLAQYVTHGQSTGEMWGVAFMVGFISFPMMASIARFFEKRKASDIKDLIKDFKGANDGSQ